MNVFISAYSSRGIRNSFALTFWNFIISILMHRAKHLFLILLLLFSTGKIHAQDVHVIGTSTAITSSHPDSCHFITPCYDQIELTFEIDSVFTDSADNSPIMVLDFPVDLIDFDTAFFVVASGLPTCARSNPLITIDNGLSCQTRLKFDSLHNCLYSGTWTIRFRINDCAIYSAPDFSMDFNLLFLNTEQEMEVEASGGNLTAEYITDTNEKFSLNLNKSSIEIDTTGLPAGMYTQNGKYFAKLDVVDRYYKIQAEEGIVDYFKLRMNVEDDAEIMLIEAMDGNNPDSSIQVIFNNSTLGSGLQGGTTFQMIFGNINDTSIYIPTQLAPDTNKLITLVGVNIGRCITQSPTTSTDSVLYHFTTIDSSYQNYILIHERLRLRKINGCSFTASTTGYGLSIYCNNQVDSVQHLDSCRYSASSLDIQGSVYTDAIDIRQFLDSNNTYLTLPLTGTLGVCQDANTVDLSVVYTNNGTTTNPSLPIESGTIEINGVYLVINRRYFDYDGISMGTQLLDTSMYTRSIDVNGIETLIIRDSAFASLTNPNYSGDTLGLDSIVHGYFPAVGSQLFKYLPVGHRIGFTFRNLRFIGCIDSVEHLALQSCGLEAMSLLGTCGIFYKNLCHIEDSLDQPVYSTNTILNNSFNGYPDSYAYPQDVGTVSGTSEVTALFTSTTFAPHALHPWQLSYQYNPIDFFICPNKNYGALINLPSDAFLLPDTIHYTDPTDSLEIVHYALSSQIDNSLNYVVNFPTLTSPSVELNFLMGIDCKDSISGPATITINFIETCDTNCRDCYISYGCTDIVFNLHCNGECESAVQTDEFKMERVSFGWNDYTNWDTAHVSVPTTPPAGISTQAKYKYYPYDIVHIRSNKGKVGSSTPIGLPNLDSLFFDISYDEASLPAGVNPLTFIDGVFKIYGANPIDSCLLSGDTLLITPDSNDVSFLLGIPGDSINPSIIRVSVDLNTMLPDTTCGHHTLLELLQATDAQIDFDANFYFNNLGLTAGYYDVPSITGQYSCVDNGVFDGSCDPYIQHLTYLQIQINQIIDTVGANEYTYFNITTMNQCEFVHTVQTEIIGGYPNALDFPGEFRPILVYPDTISVFNGIDAVYTRGVFQDLGGCVSNYGFLPTGANAVDLSGSPCHLTIEKTASALNVQQLAIVFEKNCAEANLTDTISFNNYVIDRFAYVPQCIPCSAINLDSIPYRYEDTDDTYTIDMDFVPPGSTSSPYIGIQNPTDTILLNVRFHPTGTAGPNATSLLNCYLYFEDLVVGDQNVSVEVRDNASNLILPTLIGTDSVYAIDTLLNNAIKTLKLNFQWNECGIPDSISYEDLLIRARIINSCSGVLDSGNINSCAYFEDSLIIRPEKADVTLEFALADSSLSGCDTIYNDFTITSLGSTLKDAFIRIVVPENIDLFLPNCTIDSDAVPLAQSLTPPTLNIDTTSLPGYVIYTFNAVNYIPYGSFYNNSLYETIPIHLEAVFNGEPNYPDTGLNSFNFTCSVIGVSGCLDTVREVNQTLQYDYYNPPLPITITGPNKICSTNDSLNADTLTASYAGGSPLSYTWTGSGYPDTVLTQYYNATYPGGLYTAYATNAIGCRLYASKFLNDSTPIITITSRLDTVPCIASPDSLFASAIPCTGCDFVWNTGDSIASIGVAPTTSSVYTVTVSNNGCVASANQSITVASYSCCGTYTNDLTQGDISSNDTIPMGNYNLVPPLGSKDIHITDTLYISPGTNIAIPDSVRIIVDRGVQLTLDSVYLFSCGDSLWQGIDLDPDTLTALYTSIIVYKSRIEDAVIGIKLNRDNHSYFIVDQSTFDKNHIDIQAKKARSFGDYSSIKKSTFTCTQWLKHPYSGKKTDIHIELERFDLDNAVTENFSNNTIEFGNIGVKAYNGCLVNSYRNTYYALVKGFDLSYQCEVLAVDRNHFSNCTTGIRANDGCVLTVEEENGFEYCTNGIWASVSTELYVGTWGNPNYFSSCWNSISATTNCDPVYIENNDIKNLGYLGVYSMGNHGSRVMVRRNYIHNTSTLTNKCKGIYLDNNVSTVGHTITLLENTIENIGMGIHISNSNAVFTMNNIVTLPNNSLHYGLRGIQIEGSADCTLEFNEVYGNSTTIFDSLSASISVSNSTKPYMTCNKVEETYKGFTLIDNTSGAKLWANNMTGCFFQFHLYNNTGIGKQGSIGSCYITSNNQWFTPASGGFDLCAENNSNLTVNQTEFIVYGSGPSYPGSTIGITGSFPSIITVPTGTFCIWPAESDPRNCEGFGDDQDRSIAVDIDDALKIATDSSDFNPENEALKWLDQKYLLKLATDNPDFTLNLSIDSAKSAIEQTTIPTFNLLDEMLVAHSDTLQSTLLTDSTSNLDSLSLVLANQSTAVNDGVIPVLQLETNEKNVNEIYLNTLFLGIYSFNEQQIETLRSVAEQCPSKGGTSVYKARGMLIFVDSVVLDYPYDCIGSNARIGSFQSSINELQVSPNPNNGQFIVSWHIETKSKNLELQVMDVEGRIVKKSKIKSNLGSIDFELKTVASGVYLIQMLDENQVVNYKKVIINK